MPIPTWNPGFQQGLHLTKQMQKSRQTMTIELGSFESFMLLSANMCPKRQLLPSLYHHLDTQNPSLSSLPIFMVPSFSMAGSTELQLQIPWKGATGKEEMTLHLAPIHPKHSLQHYAGHLTGDQEIYIYG